MKIDSNIEVTQNSKNYGHHSIWELTCQYKVEQQLKYAENKVYIGPKVDIYQLLRDWKILEEDKWNLVRYGWTLTKNILILACNGCNTDHEILQRCTLTTYWFSRLKQFVGAIELDKY